MCSHGCARKSWPATARQRSPKALRGKVSIGDRREGSSRGGATRPVARLFRTIDGGNEMSAYKLFVCVQCGFEYDEAKGWPEDGIAPGTRWDDIPDDWSCPDCGAAKSDFEMVEVARS